MENSLKNKQWNTFLFYFVDPSALDAERILIDGDELAVEQNGFEFGPDGSQIDGHEQRCRQNAPDGHLRFGLLVAQAEVAHDQLPQRETKQNKKELST